MNDNYGHDASYLIQLLLDIQERDRWLSEEALAEVSERLSVPLARVYQVATFYKAFSLVPRGKHSISVCLGTACQVRGASRLIDRVVDAFGVRPGENSADMRFSLNAVNCLGCCALGPIMTFDGTYYSKPTTQELEQLASVQ